ncbi:MAG: nickel-dependent lactate racemase [Coriobacteriia bacterium]|nr:nickel-dependent lactate racemase [Coriobacteriia bacterium]
MLYKIPYGYTYQKIDLDNATLIDSKINQLSSLTNKSGFEIVREAMDKNPLYNLAKDAKTCTIILSDHTRPVPSKDIIPNMLHDLRQANSNIDIKLLIATGFHRKTKKDELIHKLGQEIVDTEKIIVHDSRDKDSCVDLGNLPSGAPCLVNKHAINTDLLIAEGFIEPHFFAGFSGGRKSVLPGVCEQTTVLANHNGQFINNKFARTGVLDNNPIHIDMVAAAKKANLKYIVNTIIDENKKTVAAFAGDAIEAHRQGCEFLKEYASVKTKMFDITITGNGGAPLDQNVYQAVKCATAAEATTKAGGTIIICAECADGHGGLSFFTKLKDCKNTRELEQEAIKTTMDKTVPDQWEYQILARIINKCKVIMVTLPEHKKMIEDMKMTYAQNINEALDMINTNNKTIAIIPNGISIIID